MNKTDKRSLNMEELSMATGGDKAPIIILENNRNDKRRVPIRNVKPVRNAPVEIQKLSVAAPLAVAAEETAALAYPFAVSQALADLALLAEDP